MIVLRNKRYSDYVPKSGETAKVDNGQGQQPSQQLPSQEEQQVTSKDLQLEQLKLQRQQQLILHQQAMLQQKETLQRQRELVQRQKMENDKDESDDKDRIKIRQQEIKDGKADNTGLYKTKSKANQPVPMKS